MGLGFALVSTGTSNQGTTVCSTLVVQGWGGPSAHPLQALQTSFLNAQNKTVHRMSISSPEIVALLPQTPQPDGTSPWHWNRLSPSQTIHPKIAKKPCSSSPSPCPIPGPVAAHHSKFAGDGDHHAKHHRFKWQEVLGLQS